MFSKSQRFREKGIGTDTPAPGTYDVNEKGHSSGQASFGKSNRFKKGDSTISFTDDSLISATPSKPVKVKSPPNSCVMTTKSGKKKPPLSDSDRIAQLEDEVRRLTSRCEELSEQLLASRQEVSSLQDRLQAEAKSKSKLQQQLESLKENTIPLGKGKELEALIAQLQGELSSLKEVNHQLEQDLDTANTTCQDKEVELDRSLLQNSTNLQEKQEIESQLNLLQEERAKMVADLSKQEQLVTGTSSFNRDLLERIKELEGLVQSQTSENRTLQGNMEEVTNELKEVKSEADARQSEHQDALEALTRKCITFEEEAAHQKQTRKEVEAILKSQLLAMEVSNRKLEKEKKASLRIITEKESELAGAKKQLDALNSEHSQDKGDMETNLHMVMQIAEEWKEKEAAQRTSLEEAMSEKRGLECELSETNSELKRIRVKLVSVERELDRAKSSDGEQNKMMTQEMSKRLVETQKKLSLEESRNETLESDLLARISELEAELERVREESQVAIDRLEDQNRLLRSQTAMAQQEAQRLSEQYAKLLGHQNHKQKVQHVKKLKDENATLKQEITKLKNEVTRHKRSIKRMEDEQGLTVTPKPLSAKN